MLKRYSSNTNNNNLIDKIELSINNINSIINICDKNEKDISSDENVFAKRIINRKNNNNNIKETAKKMLLDLTNDTISDNNYDNIEQLLLKDSDELTIKELQNINKEYRKMLLLKKHEETNIEDSFESDSVSCNSYNDSSDNDSSDLNNYMQELSDSQSNNSGNNIINMENDLNMENDPNMEIIEFIKEKTCKCDENSLQYNSINNIITAFKDFCQKHNYIIMYNKFNNIKPINIKDIMIKLGYDICKYRAKNYTGKLISDKTLSYNINLALLLQ